MTATSEDVFCATSSREHGEPLAGTATRVDVWLLLEYQGPFGKKATDETELPAAVRGHLEHALAQLPHSRLQFIRRTLGDREGVTFSIAVPDEIHPRLTTFHLSTMDEIAAIDIVAVVQGDQRYDDHIANTPMVIVCVNGTRDRCCALRGIATANKLAERLGDQVWCTTHLGGHRFAATGVILPYGITFGRLDDADLNEFVADSEGGRIHLPTLRGRSNYEPPAQAADYFLRQQTGLRAFDAFRMVSIDALEADRWVVTFAEAISGLLHHMQIKREDSAYDGISSCGSSKAKPSDLYSLVSYERSDPTPAQSA